MSMKRKACAYCGTTAPQIPRERGHVFARCTYPDDMDRSIQRPTVPECARCKMIWQDAENQFRNIMVLASTGTGEALHQWNGPIKRSFDKPSGHRWKKDLFVPLVKYDTSDGPALVVYPAKDRRVMIVMRKIIRGLCHYHKLGTEIVEPRVYADVIRQPIPEAMSDQFTHINLGNDFCQYAYCDLRDDNDGFNSAWLFRFYGRCEFMGIVCSNENKIMDMIDNCHATMRVSGLDPAPLTTNP